jgi:aminopeptidase N
VFEVRLPRPVLPGQEVEFRIKFHDAFPEVFARTGYKRDFFMGGQWFPKIGVWWKGASIPANANSALAGSPGWNCHQFHETTEFFSDFGSYDVKLTLPESYVVGASGMQVGSVSHSDGTKTVAFHGDAIHDFAWSASPRFREVLSEFQGSAGPVKIRLLIEPSHLDQADRYLYALRQSMQRFDQWYGPYPYPQITVIDPPHGAGRAGGMEYPTLITVGTFWWMPRGVRVPEITIEHEFGHQYWYGMVANNEFEDAWLDEGINSYTEVKVMDSIYGPDTSALQLAGLTLGEAGLQRRSYLSEPDTDPITRPGWQFLDRNAYGAITYGKSATMLLTLEKLIGEDTMRQALRTYFARYRFTHPGPQDFLKTLEEVSGRDLHGYFEQAVYGTSLLDYEISELRSDRPDWAHRQSSARQEQTADVYYTTTVVVRRKGDFVYPVDVAVKFDNGQTTREHWDGRDRWVRYTYHLPAKAVSAEVDPNGEIWLDRDLFNNSRTAESSHAATHKLANYWLVLTQLLSQVLSWLV